MTDRPEREHGTHNCYVHGPDRRYSGRGCRCEPCRAAHAAYEAQRKRRVEPPYVDATSSREHLAWLSTQGVGWKHAARAAGLSPSVVWKIVYGRNGVPAKRVRPATRDAILAVRPAQGADGSRIDAAETWRHIDTLLARGWTKAAIARGIGQERSLQVSRSTVTRRNARAIAALLDQPVPPRRSRFGLHPVPQPEPVDPQEALRDEARRAQAAERQAAYRAKRNAEDGNTTDYELPTLDLGLVLRSAPCRRPEVPTWLFFPDPGDTETIDRAKAACATCRWSARCLAWALAHGEQGVWGGTTDAERNGMREQAA